MLFVYSKLDEEVEGARKRFHGRTRYVARAMTFVIFTLLRLRSDEIGTL